MTHKKTMTPKAHVGAVLTLGLPLIGGHLAQIAINTADTVMLGWYGIAELAALTVAGAYFFVLFIFGSGFAFAVMPMVAQFAAEDDDVSLRRATRMGLWLSLGFGVLVLPLMFAAQPVLALLGQEPEVTDLAAAYLKIAGWGMIPALLVMVLKSYLAALERTQVVLWITLCAAIINVIGNYIFIFGNWGGPEMGMRGAALASLITQAGTLVITAAYARWVLPQHQLFVRLWKADWAMLFKVARVGMPIGVTVLCETGLFAMAAVMMGWLGTVPLAAHGIAMQLASITFMVHLGLGNVATIRAGNAYGRRDADHMARGAWVTLALSILFSLLTIVFFVVWPETLIRIFMRAGEPAEAQIIATGIGLLIMAALFQLVDGAQAIALGLLRGVQDTTVPMVIAALSYWAVGIPCSYLLGFVLGWEGVGVWAGLVIGLGGAALMLNLRFWCVTLPRLGREQSTPVTEP